jgi:formylglycine-generating enzyme required for sulfatase activity
MPPTGPMDDASIATILAWINAEAATTKANSARVHVTTAQMLDYMVNDLRVISADPYLSTRLNQVRYITMVNLHNDPTVTTVDLEAHRLGMSKLLNSLSWSADIAVPESVDPDHVIFRIFLNDYDWTSATWDFLAGHYPYALSMSDANFKELERVLGTSTPFMRADWLAFEGSKPPLYHDLARIPHTARELEAKLSVDVDQNIRNGDAKRAGFVGGKKLAIGSGVSDHNRLLERHETPHGAYWKSYDFAGSSGPQSIFDRPLGPTSAGVGDPSVQFVEDGGEIVFNLPNGLQGYMIVDGKGNRINVAPAAVVRDKTHGNREVVNGVSCMACHVQGMRQKEDQILVHVRSVPSFDQYEREISALYPPAKEMNKLFAKDTKRFTRALEEVGVVSTGAASTQALDALGEPIAVLARHFEDDLLPEQVAADLHLTLPELNAHLTSDPRLASLHSKLRAGGITRADLTLNFPLIAETLALGSPIQPTFAPTTPTTPTTPPNPYIPPSTPSAPIGYVEIPAGSFVMGSPTTELGHTPDETQHAVTISRAFFLKQTEVTQGEWQAVMGNNPSHFTPCGNDCPVDHVSWYDALLYCNALSDKEGLTRCYDLSACTDLGDNQYQCPTTLDFDLSCNGYRLPTEAEWEYAYRAGTTSAFYNGDITSTDCSLDPTIDAIGWYCGNSAVSYPECGDASLDGGAACVGPHPVGEKTANALGLYDMAGHVFEWCWDQYGEYPSDPQRDPKGALHGSDRVIRGGSWFVGARVARAAFRNSVPLGVRDYYIGFRPARSK